MATSRDFIEWFLSGLCCVGCPFKSICSYENDSEKAKAKKMLDRCDKIDLKIERELFRWCIDNEDNEFEEILNEVYGEVTVCGYTHGSGTLLRRIDPVAFDQMKKEFLRYNPI